MLPDAVVLASAIVIYKMRPSIIHCGRKVMAKLRSSVLAPAVAAIVPVALAVAGLGCVDLDKPDEVAACASGRTGPCTDNGQPDAPWAPDARPDSPHVDGHADGAVAPADAGAGADGVGPGRTDAFDVPVLDTAPIGLDGAVRDVLDTRPADTQARDAAWLDVPSDGALADQIGLLDGVAPDVVDVAPEVAAPDLPGLADVADTATAADHPDAGSAVVTFKAGRGDGIMTGYGWVTLGSADTVTSPTCGPANAPITGTAPCTTQTNWNQANALCVSGSIPALPPAPTPADYAANWGIQVGVNASEPNAAIGQSFSAVGLAISGTPNVGLRIELHRAGDPVGTTYCALWTSSDPVPLTSFNTECWDNGGLYLAAADVSNLDKVGLQVTSGPAAITVTDLCIESIVFVR
jgi:hypothetical protein